LINENEKMNQNVLRKFLLPVVLIGLEIFLAGCEKEYSEVVDPIQNVPPVIRNLQAPDTLNLHSTDTLRIFLRVEVFDADGYSDIKSVYFNSFLPDGSPSRSNPIYLFDDGNFQVNGDPVARDGIFSRIIILPPNTTRGTYRFDFQAVDKKDESSNIISHNLVVR